MRRALWTVAYWKRAPAGGGGDVDPMRGEFGWEVRDGSVVVASAPLRGGVIHI